MLQENRSYVVIELEEGKMPVEVAGNLGIPVGLLYKWIRQYKGMDSQGKANDPATLNRTQIL